MEERIKIMQSIGSLPCKKCDGRCLQIYTLEIGFVKNVELDIL